MPDRFAARTAALIRLLRVDSAIVVVSVGGGGGSRGNTSVLLRVGR